MSDPTYIYMFCKQFVLALHDLLYDTIHVDGTFNQVADSLLLLSCWDPHLIAEILSDPRSIPYCCPNFIPIILWDSNTMLTMPPNSDQPPRPLTHYHHSLRTLNNLWEPQSHFCLHHSVLVLLHSNLVFTSPSQFSSFYFWYITLFQYSCSLVLAPALPLYISTSLTLNSCNPL